MGPGIAVGSHAIARAYQDESSSDNLLKPGQSKFVNLADDDDSRVSGIGGDKLDEPSYISIDD